MNGIDCAGTTDKQGSRHVRWAAVEAVSKNHGGGKIKAGYRRISERPGRNIGRVAAARRVLRLVYVRHEVPSDRVGWKDPPLGGRSRPLKLEAA